MTQDGIHLGIRRENNAHTAVNCFTSWLQVGTMEGENVLIARCHGQSN